MPARARRLGRVGGIAILVVLSAVGAAVLPGSLESATDATDARDDVEVVRPEGAADPGVPSAPVGCDPPGCLDWHTTDLDQRPILLVGDLLVQDGRDHLVAVDIATGETRWQHQHATTRPVSVPTGYERYAARSGDDLAIAMGTSIWFHDLATGQPRAELELDGLTVHGLEPVGDGVLVRGRGGLAMVAADEGVRWRDDRRVIGVAGGAILVTDGEDVAALDPWEGAPRWEREGLGPHVLVLGSQLVHADEDGLVLRDAVTGTALYREPLGGTIEYVREVGAGLVAAVTGDRVHLIHPDSRRILEVRERSSPDRPLYGPIAERSSDGFVAVWSGEQADETEVVLYPSGAGETVAVPLEVDPPTEGRLQRIAVDDLGDGQVRVRFPGAQIRDVDLRDGEVVRMLDRDSGWNGDDGGVTSLHPDSGDLQMEAGLLLEPRDGAARVIGLEGAVVVDGMTGLVAGDPPIVHGPGGAARLDPQLLWPSPPAGPPLMTREGRSAPATP